MGLLGSIMEKLGLGTASPPPSSSAPQATPAPQAASAPLPTASVGPKGVDVVAKLEKLADAYKEKLNWKTSLWT